MQTFKSRAIKEAAGTGNLSMCIDLCHVSSQMPFHWMRLWLV